ncbi:MAG: hypothetical protein K6G91_11080, partial [Kiritimatiellae bacterium]|nr:hypothetical protein [Kiritimatiellia bacterium]
ASSVAAIGIGVGMVGAAAASLLAAVKGMGPLQLLGAVAVIVLVVSLPSVILTWFKLRRRDIGAVLNASGWAINRQMRFSMKRGREFTKCAKCSCFSLAIALVVAVAVVIALLSCCQSNNSCGQTANVTQSTNEVQNAQN